jgi:uridylate kinase
MDGAAIGMCRDNGLPIIVFNYKREGNIERVVAGEPIGTWVCDRPRPQARPIEAGQMSPASAQ